MGGHGSGTALIRSVAGAAVKEEKKKKVSPRKLLMQRKAQQVAEEASASLLFHCSGVTCRQWRELKNALAPIQGKGLFQPNYKNCKNGDGDRAALFSHKVASLPGPLCLLYLGHDAPQEKLVKLLPPPSLSNSMLLLFGQQQSNLLNHVDVKKAASLDLVSVYRRGVFTSLLHPMLFFSGLDRLKGAVDAQSSTSADGNVPSSAPAAQ